MKVEEKLEKCLEAYCKKFDDPFPLMWVSFSDEEAIDIMEKAIKTGKPYRDTSLPENAII